MKSLKGLGRKNFNIMFHTHTVAGIVISFGLFVIFYAGSFSFFREEIKQWENQDMRQPVIENMDYDAALMLVDSTYEGLNFHQNTNVWFPSEHSPVLGVYGATDLTDSTTERMSAYVSPMDMSVKDIKDPETTVAMTIYVLHYFGQIPTVGLYLAGIVSLFFLFAVVTGLLVHWKNLLTKFYAFVNEGKWKVIWTNSHTVLGVISLPFQVVYAVTGALFGLLTLILIPTVFILYDGDAEKVGAVINPAAALKVEEDAPISDHYSINELKVIVEESYPDFEVSSVSLRNYGKEDALALWNITDHEGILADGSLAMRMKDGIVLEEYSILPYQRTYSTSVINFLFKLHFGDFGGYVLRAIYFILGMITCYMIISGIMIWRTARDNGNYTLKQRIFHHRVTKWYLAICLSMFPAFAIIFMANKLVPMDLVGRVDLVNQIFFLSWLALTVIGYFWKSYSLQNKNYLIIGGLLSLVVPIVNGVVTGGWLWNMWGRYHWVAYIDLFWLFSGLTALYLSFIVLKVKSTTDFPQPMDGSEMSDQEPGSEEVLNEPDQSARPVKKPVLQPQLAIKGTTK